jgi:hypothetical protein
MFDEPDLIVSVWILGLAFVASGLIWSKIASRNEKTISLLAGALVGVGIMIGGFGTVAMWLILRDKAALNLAFPAEQEKHIGYIFLMLTIYGVLVTLAAIGGALVNYLRKRRATRRLAETPAK